MKLLVLIPLLALAACISSKQISREELIAEWEGSTVSSLREWDKNAFMKINCLFDGPWIPHKTYTIIISGNGEVSCEGKSGVKWIGQNKITLSERKTVKIVQSFLDAQLSGMNESYGCGQFEDGKMIEVYFSYEGKSKAICFSGDEPEALDRLVDKVYSFVDIEMSKQKSITK